MKIYAFNLGVPHQWLPPKMLLIMKMIIIIMTALLVQASAASLAQKITYVQKNAALSQIFSEIRKQTGYDVLWPSPELDVTQKINADFKNAGLQEVLSQCLVNGKFSFTIEDKTIVIKEKEPSFLDRFLGNDDRNLADIRGVVRNERGEPLEGITVMVKGAKTGTRTNARGEFVLKGVKKGDVLVFTGVAIEPFEYTVKDDKNIDLNLKARLVQLEEVGINTGYQKISKERFVGSYSQLDSAAFHRRAGMGILERLDGTVTGVLFNKKGLTNLVGETNPIQIRGLSTLQSNPNPLVIVDNFPYTFDLNTINPNDVENITVLKDAAAASIWGARAGNGVIVITTKKGKFNQPLRISWNSNVSIQNKPDLYHYPQVSSSDFIDFEQYLFLKGAYDFTYHHPWTIQGSPVVEVLNKVKNGNLTELEGKARIDRLRGIDSREQLNRYVYQPEINQQHYLNIGGGSNNINYSISLGYNNTRPNIQNSKNNDQYTINSNASFKVGKKISVSTGINLSQGTVRSTNLPSLVLYPYSELADENGNSLPITNYLRLDYLDTVGNGRFLDWHFRPLDEIKLADENNITRTASINSLLSYAATSWLTLDLSGQYSFQNIETRSLKSLETFEARDLINTFTNLSFTDALHRYPVPIGGLLDGGIIKSNVYNIRGGISINKNWTENQLTAMISGDLSESRANTNTYRFYGYQPEFAGFNPNIDYVNDYPLNPFGSGSTGRIPNENRFLGEKNIRFISLTANASYTFRNKYTAYGSARRDGSNLFGVNIKNKWKPLWSLGAAWQVDKEDFFQVPWIDHLNLKTTYGYSGNVNNTISGLLTIAYAPFPNTFTGLPQANRSNPPNPNLRWEEVKIFNSSVDFSLLKGRITGNFQYFRKTANDLISQVPRAALTGVPLNYPSNVACLKGDGLELNLGLKILEKDLKWRIDGGLSYVKMKVAKIYADASASEARSFLSFGINPHVVGKIAYGLSSYRWSGLDPETGDPQGFLKGEVSKDYYGIIADSVDNQVFHGSSIPLYSGFLMNTLSWKSLSLSFNIGYKLGYYFRRPVINYFGSPTNLRFLPADYYVRWKEPGDEKYTNVPSIVYPSPDDARMDFYANSEINVLRGDHIRLQDLRLHYSLGSKLKHLSFVKNLNASAYINNLNIILWRKNKSSLDPEFAGTNVLLSPSPKTITLGLSANF